MITVFQAVARCESGLDEILDARGCFHPDLCDVVPGIGPAPVTLNGTLTGGETGVVILLGYDPALPIDDPNHPVRTLVREAVDALVVGAPELADFELVCVFDDGDPRHAVEVLRRRPGAPAEGSPHADHARGAR